MRRRGWWAAAGLLLALAGCGSRSEGGGARPAAGDDPIAAAGAGAVTLAMWSGAWDRLAALEEAVVAAAPPAERGRIAAFAGQARREISTPWHLVRVLARIGHLPAPPEELPGLDESRPLVVSLLLPPCEHEAAAASAAAWIAGQGALEPVALRSRLVVPSTRPAETAAALRRAASAGGMTADGAGAVTHHVQDGALIRVAAGERLVVVDVVLGAPADLSAGRRAALLTEPPAEPVHPMLGRAGPSVARLQVRFDGLARVAPCTGMSKMIDAFAAVGSGGVHQMLMQGYSEVLASAVVMDPAGRLVSDLVADLPAADGPARPVLALRLTAEGARALGRDPALARGAPVSPLDVDWTRIALEAPRSPALPGGGAVRDAAELVHECGWSCSVYLGAGNGLGLLAPVLAEEPAFLRDLATRLAAGMPALREARVQLTGAALILQPLGAGEAAAPAVTAAAAAPAAQADAAAPDRCYLSALAAVRQHLARAVSSDPAHAPVIFQGLRATAAGDLACARKDAALARRIGALERALGLLEQLSASTR